MSSYTSLQIGSFIFCVCARVTTRPLHFFSFCGCHRLAFQKFELTFVASGSFIWIYDVFSGRGGSWATMSSLVLYPGGTHATFRISHFEHRRRRRCIKEEKGVFNGIHFISPRLMWVAFHSPSTSSYSDFIIEVRVRGFLGVKDCPRHGGGNISRDYIDYTSCLWASRSRVSRRALDLPTVTIRYAFRTDRVFFFHFPGSYDAKRGEGIPPYRVNAKHAQ